MKPTDLSDFYSYFALEDYIERFIKEEKQRKHFVVLLQDLADEIYESAFEEGQDHG